MPGLYNGRDRTFFFHSFETSRGCLLQDLLNPTVPQPRGALETFQTSASDIRDPLNNNAPFPGNRIPESRLNPVSKKIQERFFPLPNFGDTSRLVSQNYRETELGAVRSEHLLHDPRRSPVLSSNIRLRAWTWNRSHSRGFEGNLPTIGQRWQTRDTRAFNASFSRTLSSNMVNEFRFGIAYNDNPRNGPLMGKQIVQELGIVGLAETCPISTEC